MALVAMLGGDDSRRDEIVALIKQAYELLQKAEELASSADCLPMSYHFEYWGGTANRYSVAGEEWQESSWCSGG